ncbi:acyl-CoA synthetase,putative [Plasmodium sp.]|nr:acyl-CoA synthetase,putative [Plasmodium sp.]
MKSIRIDIWRKDINYFSEDIYKTKGNIIGGVPKIFSTMYTSIMNEINNLPFLKRCMEKGVLSLDKTSNYDVSYTQIARELSVLLNVNTYQVYGLTESDGAIFVQKHNDFDIDSVGGTIAPTTKYKVKTWEFYKDTNTLPKGELLVKRDSVFCLYFLEKEL